MEKTKQNKEKEWRNSRELIKENLENLVKGYKKLWELVEKLCVTELFENSNPNAPLKDDMAMSNKKFETEKKLDTLTVSEINTMDFEVLKSSSNFDDDTETWTVSEINTMDSEVLKSSSNFGDDTGTLTSTLECLDVDAGEFLSDSISDSTAILWSSSSSCTSSPRMTLDITETSRLTAKNLHDNLDAVATCVTAKQVKEAIQQTLISLSEPHYTLDDFLSSHSLNTYRDLNALESETEFRSSDLTHSPVDHLEHTGQRSNNLFQLPNFVFQPANAAEENSSSSADFNSNELAIETNEDSSRIDLEWEYNLKPVYIITDPSIAHDDPISGRNLEQHGNLMPFSTDSNFTQSGLHFEEEHFSLFNLQFPNKEHKIDEKMMNIKNLSNNEIPNIDQQSTNIIVDNNQESNFNSDATVLKDVPYASTTTGDDGGHLSLVDKYAKDRRKLSNRSSNSYSTVEKDARSTVSSTETNDKHPDTLTDIFKTVLKCHPLKKFEIPPYASDNADGMVGIEVETVDDSYTRLTPNSMQLHGILQNPPILGEYSSNIDSDSLIVFEIKDCFSENSSIMCDALITEYLNIAVKLTIFLLKKAQDVSFEDYGKRMDNLQCLDDELGYFSAKLISVRNDWVKQSEEINQNLRNNSQMVKRSKGLYHISILKTCQEITTILINFCFGKQIELENYEKELAFYHGYKG